MYSLGQMGSPSKPQFPVLEEGTNPAPTSLGWQGWTKAQGSWTCLIHSLLARCELESQLNRWLPPHLWCYFLFLLSSVLYGPSLAHPLISSTTRSSLLSYSLSTGCPFCPESAHKSMDNLLRCHIAGETYSRQFICNHSLILLTPSFMSSPSLAFYPSPYRLLAQSHICLSFVSFSVCFLT